MGMSHKDRIVRNILRHAEDEGKLVPRSGATLVAASSGNTGASVAMIGAQRGYRVVIITDAKCSAEKCDAIRLYGAELIIAGPGQDYMQMDWHTSREVNRSMSKLRRILQNRVSVV